MSLDYRNCINYAFPYLSDNPIVVDCGCNIDPIVEMGNAEWVENWNDDFTSIFLELNQNANCIGIEPLHWKTYEQKWGGDFRVKLLKIGLSDRDENEVVYVPGIHHVVSSFYNQSCFLDYSPNDIKKIEIPCKKLDTIFDELKLTKIDYLKIDTEGAEYKILCGAKELLENHKILFIQFEYGLLDKTIPPVEDIYNLLNQYKYNQILISGREQLWVNLDLYKKIKEN